MERTWERKRGNIRVLNGGKPQRCCLVVESHQLSLISALGYHRITEGAAASRSQAQQDRNQLLGVTCLGVNKRCQNVLLNNSEKLSVVAHACNSMLKRLRQEDCHEFKVILNYKAGLLLRKTEQNKEVIFAGHGGAQL